MNAQKMFSDFMVYKTLLFYNSMLYFPSVLARVKVLRYLSLAQTHLDAPSCALMRVCIYMTTLSQAFAHGFFTGFLLAFLSSWHSSILEFYVVSLK